MLLKGEKQEGIGIVYIIHFSRKLAHAGHYVGWVKNNLETRLEKHRKGTGARLLQVLKEKGISWEVALVLNGNRKLERAIKKRHYGRIAKICPICKALTKEKVA